MVAKVLVNGANGKMGQEAVKAITSDAELELVATCGRQDNLAETIRMSQANIVIDLTIADTVFTNTKIIIENNAHPIIGTSGLLPEQVQQLTEQCLQKKLGGIIVPNFSIGAVLMMHFSSIAAQYLPHVEVIEQHHDGKRDAPSGTAIKTAEMIMQARCEPPTTKEEQELLIGARGAEQHNIHIHSVRLPGIVAKQQVIFGSDSETLMIEHNSIHRRSFMPGLLLACKKVTQLDSLLYGLESILLN